MKPRTLCAVIAGLVLTLPRSGMSEPTTITDTTPGVATNDGVVSVGEYPGSSSGINDGFGGVLGPASALHVDTSAAGQLNLGLVIGGEALKDRGVIYIDSVSGGVLNTIGLTDTNDTLRRMISGSGLSYSADLVFGPGFQPDFAIGFDSTYAGLWTIVEGGPHANPKSVNGQTGDGGTNWEMNLDLGDIGLVPGQSFRYIASYGNPDGFGGVEFVRSDEFHGVASSSVMGGNPGTATVTLVAGDYNTFVSYGEAPDRGPVAIVDTTIQTATADGTINFGEYVGFGLGINSGFGNVFGEQSQLYVDSDPIGTGALNFGLRRGPGTFNDQCVIYIDSVPGGPTNTTTLTDTSDTLRKMISGSSITGSADLHFPPGFAPDYAIGLDGGSGFAGLWQILETGFLPFVRDLGLQHADRDYEVSMTLDELGISRGDTFKYVLTYGNAESGTGVFRSDEFHGVSTNRVTGGNPGNAPVTLGEGDYNTFTSVPVGRIATVFSVQ